MPIATSETPSSAALLIMVCKAGMVFHHPPGKNVSAQKLGMKEVFKNHRLVQLVQDVPFSSMLGS